MKLLYQGLFCSVVSIVAAASSAAEHRVEVLKEAPPAEQLSNEIAGQLAPTGLAVYRGESRTVCRIWPCKKWNVRESFQPGSEVLYPFKPGELFGVLQLKRKTGEFRDRNVPSGVYTLRYAYQPTDGNHEGTFPTRDFLVMASAEKDRSPKPMAVDELIKLSGKVISSNHPAMLCLLKPTGDAKTFPAVRHNEDKDWWIVQFKGKAAAGEILSDLRVDLVVAGFTEE